MTDSFRHIRVGVLTGWVVKRPNGDWSIRIGNDDTRLEASDIDAAEAEGREVFKRRLTEALKELDQ